MFSHPVKGFFLIAVLLLSLATSSCSSIGPVISAAGRNIVALFRTPREVPNKITQPYRDDARLAVTWIGHATALIQIDDKFILTDPVLTTTAGQFSKRLVEPGIDPENIPTLDAVIISHLHVDHLSLGTLDMIEPKMKRLFVPEGGLVYVPDYNCEVAELGLWHSWEGDGLRISAVPVIHNGWRYGLDAAWMTTSCTGYMVEYHGINVYFGGDTAYDSTLFVETSRRFPKIDLAILPIAPIHPREYTRVRHTDPKEALSIFLDLDARYMVPIHFDTFSESYDTLGEAPATLREEIRIQELTETDVVILEIGEQWTFINRQEERE